MQELKKLNEAIRILKERNWRLKSIDEEYHEEYKKALNLLLIHREELTCFLDIFYSHKFRGEKNEPGSRRNSS